MHYKEVRLNYTFTMGEGGYGTSDTYIRSDTSENWWASLQATFWEFPQEKVGGTFEST